MVLMQATQCPPKSVRTVVLLSSAPGELQVCLRDSVIYSHGVIRHFICSRLVCFPGCEELVSGKPILLSSCSEPIVCLSHILLNTLKSEVLNLQTRNCPMVML